MEQSIRAAGAAAPHLHGERRPAIHVRLDETFLEPVCRTLGADAWQGAAQEGAASASARRSHTPLTSGPPTPRRRRFAAARGRSRARARPSPNALGEHIAIARTDGTPYDRRPTRVGASS